MDNKQFYEYIFRGGGKQIGTTLPDGVNRQFDSTDMDAACFAAENSDYGFP